MFTILFFITMVLVNIPLCAESTKEIQFTATPITKSVFKRIQYSWKDYSPIPLTDLRLLNLAYWGYDGQIHQGELMVHEKVAQEVIVIFQELFELQFPIERMQLIDEYQADDDCSMEANNTSAYNCRRRVGFNDFSKHSYGIAIDINPRVNPYVRGNLVLPSCSRAYCDRSLKNVTGFITEDGSCCQIFAKHGWNWGGDFEGRKDYHHFEKPLSFLEDDK